MAISEAVRVMIILTKRLTSLQERQMKLCMQCCDLLLDQGCLWLCSVCQLIDATHDSLTAREYHDTDCLSIGDVTAEECDSLGLQEVWLVVLLS